MQAENAALYAAALAIGVLMSRSVALHVTGFLWRFQWFRVCCIKAMERGLFIRAIGLYTPFWWAARNSFAADGACQDLRLSTQAGQFERHYERLARVARL